jgi:predicted O-methyltransferase YrrM
VVLDNVLLGGRVFDEAEQGERVTTMRSLNDRVATDDRVDVVMLPVRDGVTVARRR